MEEPNCEETATVEQDNGSTALFAKNKEGKWYAEGGLNQATLTEKEGKFIYTLPNQTVMRFNGEGWLTSETDPNGSTLTMTRGSGGRLESVSDEAGRKVTFTHNGKGEITSATDPMGHTTEYTYSSNNLVSVTEPGEGAPRWQYKYNANHEMTEMTDGRGGTVTTTYDEDGRVISEKDAMGRTRKWEYAVSGRGAETTITEPNGAVTYETFNNEELPTSVTHAYGTSSASTTTYGYDEKDELTSVSDPDGHETTCTYNEEGDRTGETDALGHKTEWTYNSAHEITSTKKPNGETTIIERDGHGNPEAITREAPGGSPQTTTYKYDADGDVESMTDPDGDTWKYEYDSYGDKTSETDPEGNKRTWKYNEDSQETSTVSPRGNVLGAEPSKFATTIERDAQGRPVTVTEPEPVGGGNEPAPESPSNTSLPEISGEPREDETLSATIGSWDGTTSLSYSYQWEDCDSLGMSCLDIPGASGSTYTLGLGDVGSTVRVVVAAINPGGSATSTSEATAVVYTDNISGLAYTSEFGSEGSSEGQLSYPLDMARDSSGDIFVADTQNNRVEEFDPEGSYIAQIGSAGEGEGQLKDPEGVTVNNKGDIFVTDTGNNRIEEFTTEGTFVRAFGSKGSGNGQLWCPEGLTVNAKKDVFVADTCNSRIEEFTEEGEYVRTIGSEGSGDGNLLWPGDVASDSSGDILVADVGNDRIEEFNETGEYVQKFGSGGSGNGEFYTPWRLTLGPEGEVWVADRGNNRIQVFSSGGEYLFQFGNQSGEGQLEAPAGTAISGTTAYVLDREGDRVETWTYTPTPTNLTAPSIEGGTVVGDTLHAGTGTWTAKPPLTYAYQWEACSESRSECHDIEGATSNTYSLIEADVGKRLEVTVTVSSHTGSAMATSGSTSVVSAAIAPSDTTAPAISGVAKERQTLSAGTGTWTGIPAPIYAYQWQKCNSSGESCVNISGAVYPQFAPGHIDVGSTLKVIVKATNGAGASSSTSSATEVIAPPVRSTRYTYDADGNLETVTDPYGKTTTYTYDADNEPVKVEQPNGTTNETEYEANGHVESETNGAHETTEYRRNLLGEAAEIIDPRSRTTVKEYDPAGNLISMTDPAGRTTTYTYDADNHLKEVSYSEGGAHSVKYEYDADGNRTGMTDGTGTTTYTYDQLDRLTKTKDGHGDTVSYEYNLANEPTKITYPNGKSIEREYDKDGRLHAVTDWLEHTTTFSYDPDSNLTAIKFPSGTGEQDTYAYDDADEMSEVKMSKGEEVLASLEYTRNENEQLTSTISKGLPGAEETNDTYNTNNLLTKAGTTDYKYDAANNPTQTGSSTNNYSEAGELESGTGISYAYNEMGQRTKQTPASGPATTYGYDQAGNLTSVERPKEGETPKIEDAYAYNGDGLRISQTISETTNYLTWDATEGVPLILNDGTNSYIYGPGNAPIEQINNSTGAVTYLHHDQAGSTRLLTGSTGTVTGICTYAAYGTPTCEGTATTPLGFDGEYTSSDTGLIYMRARTYDPSTAQFLSVDPLAKLTRAPYNFAEDNPLNESDPTGLGDWLGLGIPSPGEVLFPGGGSTQVCVGGTVSLGVTVSLEGCYVHTPHGEGITITPSVGFGAGAAVNGHFGIGESNACRPSEYGGLFSQAGGSAEFGTGGYYNRFSSFPYNEFSGSKRVEGWTTGGSVGLGAEGGGGISDTVAIPLGGGGSGSSGCGCS